MNRRESTDAGSLVTLGVSREKTIHRVWRLELSSKSMSETQYCCGHGTLEVVIWSTTNICR